ncbi:cupin domain-containing protein [Neolewinella aurantiaca]|uniref:Cupin domain-containing protein n=1 Tax=Neolewinella aurantiaca TaxID=2602767 RepID=A0A5C7FI69_9BACT|nr:cupin domain-containing protein [Neolewinella aurantiaca]TXF89529.1 cupin domain-containing protein [Neolewinella aurantiaca]
MPSIPYYHVYTDEDGVSRQKLRHLTDFEEESMGGDSGSQWNNKLMKGATQIIFSELPADFDGDWHENPQPQWIVPLSGGWWVETMDGERVEMRTGDLSFGADQGTNGEKGHRSGVLDGKPCQMMIIQVTDNEQLKGGKVAPDEL